MTYDALDYSYDVGWSEVDEAWVVHVVDFPGLATHGATREDAIREARLVVNAALEYLAADGIEPPVPLSRRTP